jgi:predicted AlkP superfamily pyrophosphatase or phosphodiesterase
MNISLVFGIALALGSLLGSVANAASPASDRSVIVISLDGFPAFALEDPKLPVPTLRRLIQEGTWCRMATINPTITWPNHTAMVTGVGADEHGLLVNGTILSTNGWPPIRVDPMIRKEQMVHAPTVYDAVFKAGLTTAQVDWVAINDAPTITWPFSEWASPDGPVEREMLARGAISRAEVQDFTKFNILCRDQVWTKAAAYIIREHRPNLMLFHLLSLDSMHHKYGPGNLAALGAMAFVDGCVAEVVEAVRQAGMTARTTFLVVSDHGFKGYTNEIRANIALEASGLGKLVYVLPEGGTGFVFLAPGSGPDVLSKAREVFKTVDGIGEVIGQERFAALGLPMPERDSQMFQLLLTAKSGYSFSGAKGGPATAAVPQQAGSHGYLASDPDMDAIFIASGFGVKPGTKLGRVANIDVGPTIAKLLSVPFETAKARPVLLE